MSVQEIRVSAATKQSCVSLALSLGKPTSKARSIAVRGPSACQVTIPHCILQPLFEVAHLTVMFNCPWHGCIMLCDNQRITLQILKLVPAVIFDCGTCNRYMYHNVTVTCTTNPNDSTRFYCTVIIHVQCNCVLSLSIMYKLVFITRHLVP